MKNNDKKVVQREIIYDPSRIKDTYYIANQSWTHVAHPYTDDASMHLLAHNFKDYSIGEQFRKKYRDVKMVDDILEEIAGWCDEKLGIKNNFGDFLVFL